MTTRRERSARFWDRNAGSYDERTAGLERRLLGPSRAWVAERAVGETLELGVGTGANLAHYLEGLRLTAIDASGAMIEQARAKAARLGRPVTVSLGDVEDLPFEDGTFNTVVATFTLCCVPDEKVALAEAVRVLRRGGRLLLADHVPALPWPVRALQHVGNLVTGSLQGEYWTRRPLRVLQGMPVEVVESERHTRGIIERVHARRL